MNILFKHSNLLDNPAVLKAVKKKIPHLKVAFCDSKEEILDSFNKKDFYPDFLMLDLTSTNYDQNLKLASDLKKELSEHQRHISIFMFVSKMQSDAQDDFLMYCDDFIEVPFSISSFIARLSVAHKNLGLINENLEFSERLLQSSELSDNLIDNLLRAVQDISLSLGNAIQYKDITTGNHILRVGHLAELLSRQMNLERELNQIKYAGFFHDIGKIGIPDEILNKPGRLNDVEFTKIKEHPGIGAEIVKPIRFFSDIIDGIRFHHERWDGKGYPEGLLGEDIPIMARIISVADVFDVITSNRPYKEAFSFDEALEEMQRCKGSQFDPFVVDALSPLVSKGEVSKLYHEIEERYKDQIILM